MKNTNYQNWRRDRKFTLPHVYKRNLMCYFKPFPQRKQGPDDFSGELYQTFRENTKPTKTLWKKKRRQTFLNLFSGISFTPIPEPDKKSSKETKTVGQCPL